MYWVDKIAIFQQYRYDFLARLMLLHFLVLQFSIIALLLVWKKFHSNQFLWPFYPLNEVRVFVLYWIPNCYFEMTNSDKSAVTFFNVFFNTCTNFVANMYKYIQYLFHLSWRENSSDQCTNHKLQRTHQF